MAGRPTRNPDGITPEGFMPTLSVKWAVASAFSRWGGGGEETGALGGQGRPWPQVIAQGMKGLEGSSLSGRVLHRPLSLRPLSVLLPVGVKTWPPHVPLTWPPAMQRPFSQLPLPRLPGAAGSAPIYEPSGCRKE